MPKQSGLEDYFEMKHVGGKWNGPDPKPKDKKESKQSGIGDHFKINHVGGRRYGPDPKPKDQKKSHQVNITNNGYTRRLEDYKSFPVGFKYPPNLIPKKRGPKQTYNDDDEIVIFRYSGEKTRERVKEAYKKQHKQPPSNIKIKLHGNDTETETVAQSKAKITAALTKWGKLQDYSVEPNVDWDEIKVRRPPAGDDQRATTTHKHTETSSAALSAAISSAQSDADDEPKQKRKYTNEEIARAEERVRQKVKERYTGDEYTKREKYIQDLRRHVLSANVNMGQDGMKSIYYNMPMIIQKRIIKRAVENGVITTREGNEMIAAFPDKEPPPLSRRSKDRVFRDLLHNGMLEEGDYDMFMTHYKRKKKSKETAKETAPAPAPQPEEKFDDSDHAIAPNNDDVYDEPAPAEPAKPGNGITPAEPAKPKEPAKEPAAGGAHTMIGTESPNLKNLSVKEAFNIINKCAFF